MKRILALLFVLAALPVMAGVPYVLSAGNQSANWVSDSASLASTVTRLRSVAGAKIFLQPGIYVVTNCLFLPTNGSLSGSGLTTVLLNMNTNQNNHQICVVPSDGSIIENLTITNGIALSNQACIGKEDNFGHPAAKNVTIRNCAFYSHGDTVWIAESLTIGAAPALTNSYNFFNCYLFGTWDGISTASRNVLNDNIPTFLLEFHDCEIIQSGTNVITPSATQSPINLSGAAASCDSRIWLYRGSVLDQNAPAGSLFVQTDVEAHVVGTYVVVQNIPGATLNWPSGTDGYYQSTNGLVVLKGKGFSGDGSGLTNTPAPTLLATNWVSGQVYTNSSGRLQEVRVAVSCTAASIAGGAVVRLQNGVNQAGLATIAQFGMQTISGSLVTTNTGSISGFIPANTVFSFTNLVGGAGDSAINLPGTGQQITY